jgi:hypothetical protein
VRWLLLLLLWVPICFVVAPSHPSTPDAPPPPKAGVSMVAAMFAQVGSPNYQHWTTLGILVYAKDLKTHYPPELRSMPQSVPAGDILAGVPWFTIAASQLDENERLIVLDPMTFLEKCLQRYDEKVQGYSCTFIKREAIRQPKGPPKKRAEETIAVCFRQDPFSVYFRWLKGGDLIPRRTLYVAGENDNKLVLPLPEPLRFQDPTGEEPMKRSRYPISQFGMRFGVQHIYDSWRTSHQAHIGIEVKYLGKETPPGDTQLCYKLESFRFDLKTLGPKPEPPDDCVKAVIYISVQDLLLVRTEMYGENDRHIATYHFKDIKLNRQFDDGQFSPSVLDGN